MVGAALQAANFACAASGFQFQARSSCRRSLVVRPETIRSSTSVSQASGSSPFSFAVLRSDERWPRSRPRLRLRRTTNSFFRLQLPVHSARVGAEVEVHYRWHALYGRRLRLHYSEVRAGTPLSYVEAGPGVIIVMPSWMLDPAACPTRRSARHKLIVRLFGT